MKWQKHYSLLRNELMLNSSSDIVGRVSGHIAAENKIMQFKGNERKDSKNCGTPTGAEANKSDTKSEFPNFFDRAWERMSPENAQPLTRIRGRFSYENSREWVEAAEIFLLPFHSFREGNLLDIRFSRKLPTGSLRFNWAALYSHLQSGIPALYEADLLILKRRIYEQGAALKDILEIDLGVELAPFVQKYQHIAEFERLFELNFLIDADLRVKRNQKQSKAGKSELNYLLESFRRFNDIVTGWGEMSADESRKMLLRVGLDEYWLDWTEAAHRAGFDFNYLARLQPVEMRFYELAQLLRFQNAEKPVKELKKAPLEIRYSEFAKLMPLPRFKTKTEVENQIKTISQIHLTNGYLKDVSVKPINRKGSFADARLQLSF